MCFGRTVTELQAVMTCREFEMWKAYYGKHGPFWWHRADWHAALVAQSLAGGKIRDRILEFKIGNTIPDFWNDDVDAEEFNENLEAAMLGSMEGRHLDGLPADWM